MNIKLKWRYASGEYDTKTLKLSAIQAVPAKGEVDAELAIEDDMILSFANVHLGDDEIEFRKMGDAWSTIRIEELLE